MLDTASPYDNVRLCYSLIQIRERFKRRIQANNPAGGKSEDGLKKSSETNQVSVNEVELSGIHEL